MRAMWRFTRGGQLGSNLCTVETRVFLARGFPILGRQGSPFFDGCELILQRAFLGLLPALIPGLYKPEIYRF
jgi:hypothetical protein